MKFLYLLFILFHLTAYADDTSSARDLFVNYMDSIYKKDLSMLTSLMDEYFLKRTGGKEHWKSILKGKQKKEQVDKVELRKVNNYYFARFCTKSEPNLTDSWFVLIKRGDKFLFYDFASDFDIDAE